ncbi:hypothetical protein PUN28_010024 [Cardiocondyla obscurior]|uniref:Uncharacterized protein n=1 Tax=Cardiocondyla obscurior TaxID=286306 RepID=A0AAW2FNI3_9HYME
MQPRCKLLPLVNLLHAKSAYDHFSSHQNPVEHMVYSYHRYVTIDQQLMFARRIWYDTRHFKRKKSPAQHLTSPRVEGEKVVYFLNRDTQCRAMLMKCVFNNATSREVGQSSGRARSKYAATRDLYEGEHFWCSSAVTKVSITLHQQRSGGRAVEHAVNTQLPEICTKRVKHPTHPSHPERRSRSRMDIGHRRSNPMISV